MEAEYRVSIVGGIWWPYGLECSTQATFHALDDEDAALYVDNSCTGDFSSVRGTMLERSNPCGTCYPCTHDNTAYCYRPHWTTVRDWPDEETAAAYWESVSEDVA